MNNIIELSNAYKCIIPQLGEPRLIHILFVYPENTNPEMDMIMYRYFGKINRMWFYEVRNRMTLDMYIEKAKDFE